MKYVIARVAMGKSFKRDMPFIFPDGFVHALVATHVEAMCTAHNWKLEGFMSAGEVIVEAISTYGESETMGTAAREEDKDLINGSDYGTGYV